MAPTAAFMTFPQTPLSTKSSGGLRAALAEWLSRAARALGAPAASRDDTLQVLIDSLDALGQGICVTGPDGQARLCNRAARELQALPGVAGSLGTQERQTVDTPDGRHIEVLTRATAAGDTVRRDRKSVV